MDLNSSSEDEEWPEAEAAAASGNDEEVQKAVPEVEVEVDKSESEHDDEPMAVDVLDAEAVEEASPEGSAAKWHAARNSLAWARTGKRKKWYLVVVGGYPQNPQPDGQGPARRSSSICLQNLPRRPSRRRSQSCAIACSATSI